MRNKIKNALVITISMAVIAVMALVNADSVRAASTVSVSANSVDLYFLDDEYISTFGSIPSSYKQSFQISASGSSYGYYYYTNSISISVSDDGVITPKKTKYNIISSSGTTTQEIYDEVETTVRVYAKNEYGNANPSNYTDVTVRTHNYATIAFENVCKDIVSQITTSSMTVEEKAKAITDYVADNYSYDARYSSALSCYLYGGADCIGCNAFILNLARAAGLEGWLRSANTDPGAGSGHVNTVIYDSVNEKYWICDAGYSSHSSDGSRHRNYYSQIEPYTYRIVNGKAMLVSYFGNPNTTSVVIPSTINGYTVNCIGSLFINNDRITSVTLPNTIETIEVSAFWYCTNLTSINIPASVTFIAEDAICWDNAITSLKVDPANTVYASVDNVIYTKDMKTLVCAPSCSSITIPNTVTTIAPGAFHYNGNITNITLPASVTTVGDSAFSNCYKLRTVTFECANMSSIGNLVFYSDYQLKKIVIKGQVDSMGINTFYGLSGNIAYGGSTAPAIPGTANITSDITLYAKASFTGNWSNDNLTIIYAADPVSALNNALHAAAGWEEVPYGYLKKWKYKLEDGNYATGWEFIGGKWYYFRYDYYMMTGWLTSNGSKYYLDTDGIMATGWKEINYNRWYYFGTSGKMATGWTNIDGQWYYFDTDGLMLTGWQSIGGQWYFLGSSGRMCTGWQSIGGQWYYFASSGTMMKGWCKIYDKWYYFNGSGVMQTGWQAVGGKWYYFDKSGAMSIGWLQIGGKWYYFNSSGEMVKNWYKVYDKWYYFNGNGEMQTGWQQIGGKWYYFYNSGAMAANTVIDGYNLGSDGAWIR